ncbi:MAG TPA: trypsin-like peptidase domain-containing protein [Candidatus Polarisedimenticolaceae bacterium]
MKTRYTFAAVLAVMGVSIVFGMVLGGWLNAPRTALAAPALASGAFPVAAASTGSPATAADWADIAERSIPAVMSVTNTSVRRPSNEADAEGDDGGPLDDPFYRFFFGPEGEDDPEDENPAPRPRRPQRPQAPQRNVSGGSGFIVSADGFIMTNDHVVENATKLVVTLDDGSKFDAKVIGTDPLLDLALIKIEAGRPLPTLPLGDSDKLRVGQWVMAIGNPLDFERTVTVGVVSGLKRQVSVGRTVAGIANFIQTDAAINFGNSGGPMLDAQGRVVGINTAILRGGMTNPMVEGIGFAIAINEARLAAEQLREGGKVERGYLGISMSQQGITNAAQAYLDLPDPNGVLIEAVSDGGPADKAGLRRDDVIRKINGKAVRNNQDLLSRVASIRPGEVAVLEVWRDGKAQEFRVTLANRPENPLADRRRTRPGGAGPDAPEPPAEIREASGLGLTVEPIASRTRQRFQLPDDFRGVLIQAVDPDSPAADAGTVVHGRILTAVNGKAIGSPAEFLEAIRGLKPGAPVKLELYRGDGTNETVFITAPEAKN